MLTFAQAIDIKNETGMRNFKLPTPKIGEYATMFEPLEMYHYYWIRHHFFFADSVEGCLTQKLQQHRSEYEIEQESEEVEV